MSTYIGRVKIGAEEAAVGSTLYGICATVANSATKTVNLDSFDAVLHGVTIFVKFNNGNTATSNVKLQIGTGTYDVVGNCVCDSGEVLSFTFDETDNGVLTNDQTKWRWRVSGHAVVPADSNSTTSAVSTTAAAGTSLQYARQDHVHNISVAAGSNSGEIVIAGQTVKPKDLGSAAYTDSSAYATSAQGTLADNAMPKSGGEFSGNVTFGNGTTLTIPTIDNSSANNAAATKKYVDDAISDVLGSANAMVFKGTIGANGNPINTTANPPQTLPTTGYSAGWTYRVITAGTYAGQVCEEGDLIIAIKDAPSSGSGSSSDWTVAQGNLDGTVIGPAPVSGQDMTSHVAIFTDNTGGRVSDSGFTLGKSVPSGAVFTDTTYTINNGSAYTSHTLTTGIANDNSTIASVSNGVLTLASGITFTTSTVNASLSHTTTGSNS